MVAAAIAALALALACQPKRPALEPHAERPHVKVMTYNVNYGLAGDEDTLAAFSDGWADLVVLQETTEAWERAVRAALSDEYPHMAFRHCCGAGGLAILSKRPLEERAYLPATGGGWFPAWHLVADTPIGPVQVLGVHLRPNLSEGGSVVSGVLTTPPIREREIAAHVESLDPEVPTLVLGDFNEGASGRAIAYLKDRGFTSALTEFDTSQETWRWTTSLGTIDAQLDHIVYSRNLKALEARALPRGNSDHLPVIGIFELAGAPKARPTR